ncbi:MAG: sulfatase-like hydrolase/transferase, partial [Gemmatimonadetes bacterium]|nr:sulfatase-like hydrolase/transferase [Gemmatimonadota bacterium]
MSVRPDPRPNIVLIMCDQMRWDAAGFAGNPTVRTPNLDRLAAGGVCFDNACCASPVCSPARASWLTGLYPHAHLQLRNYGPARIGEFGASLPAGCVTIGDVLKAAGYRCGMVG